MAESDSQTSFAPGSKPLANENGEPRITTSELRNTASSLISPDSLLDGLTSPIELESIRQKAFDKCFEDLVRLANYLGFSWIAGLTSQYNGQGYHYVRSGDVGGTDYARVTGPGYTPDMSGTGNGYWNDKRTSFSFPNAWLTFDDISYGDPIKKNERVDTLLTFNVDNRKGQNESTTDVSFQFFEQGSVEKSLSRNWSKNINWNVSLTETMNFGDPTKMFPSGSVSATEGIGGSSTQGGGTGESSSVSTSVTSTISNRQTTPALTLGQYAVTGTSTDVLIPFTSVATLNFSARMHGFMKYGDGHKFSGNGNFHKQYSGSGDRPTVDWTIGNDREPWWQALKHAVENDEDPWAWEQCSRLHPEFKPWIDSITRDDYASKFRFSVQGLLGGVTRRNVSFIVIKQDTD